MVCFSVTASASSVSHVEASTSSVSHVEASMWDEMDSEYITLHYIPITKVVQSVELSHER